ncbi:MAG: manganese efflux pump [Actinobacteria bacterium]|nr:manganese efflux pump [Actinomycetota bacterium]
MINLLMISVSLAMDCLSVSIAGGATTPRPKIYNALKVGLSFGAFQAAMPLIGWSIGLNLRVLIENIDHWIAFLLLSAIGIKMLYEAFKKTSKNNNKKNKTNITKMPTLFILSLATSIDSLVVGVSISILNMPIYLSILMIGLFAFSFSIFGYFIGHRIGKIIGNKSEIIGGIILIGIGAKILIEHMM